MSDDDLDQDKMAAEWAAAMSEQESSQDDIDALLGDMAAPAPAAERAPLDEFEAPRAGPRAPVASPDLDVILDIPVRISMEVGNTEITIRNLLQLNQGSVIELDRLAGEPLDVLVNGTLIAHGEVVVVNEKFGIRMTDVISPSERIKKLR
jgi:flagellar motor switch protein FliN/FliY